MIIASDSWKILKHIDKAGPKEDPNETLVFRCLGDGVEVDDIRVWAPKK